MEPQKLKRLLAGVSIVGLLSLSSLAPGQSTG